MTYIAQRQSERREAKRLYKMTLCSHCKAEGKRLHNTPIGRLCYPEGCYELWLTEEYKRTLDAVRSLGVNKLPAEHLLDAQVNKLPEK